MDCDNEYFQITQGTIWDGRTCYDLFQEAYTPWEWQPKLILTAGSDRPLNVFQISNPRRHDNRLSQPCDFADEPLSRADGGPDAAFSMEPAEFKQMVDEIRIVEKALGRVTYSLTKKQERSPYSQKPPPYEGLP